VEPELQVLHRMLVSLTAIYCLAGTQRRSRPVKYSTNSAFHSLEKEPGRRATPWRMLEHPWMVDMRSKRVNMEKYLAQVWGWDDPEPTATVS
jgi:hypothetical protein